MSTFQERRAQWRRSAQTDMVMFESPEDHPMLSAPEVLELLDALDKAEEDRGVLHSALGDTKARVAMLEADLALAKRTYDESPRVVAAQASVGAYTGEPPTEIVIAGKVVPIEYDPDLPRLGLLEWTSDGGRVMRLREWNERVFLHEVLHGLLQPYLPHGAYGYTTGFVEDPKHELAVRAIENCLWEMGWRWQVEPAFGCGAEPSCRSCGCGSVDYAAHCTCVHRDTTETGVDHG